MTVEEALEALFAMASVQDGYAKKAADPGLKLIHKANAKAQREVAITIKDLRARLAEAEGQVKALIGALDAIAGYNDMPGVEWRAKYPDLTAKYDISRKANLGATHALAVYARAALAAAEEGKP